MTAMPVGDVAPAPARASPRGRPTPARRSMCASTSAIVCGCSSCRNDSTCCGSARRRNSNGISTSSALSRSRISRRLVRPEGGHEHLLGVREAALGEVVARGGQLLELAEHRSGDVGVDLLQPHDLGGELLDLGSRSDFRTWAERSLPICTSSTAALRRPVMLGRWSRSSVTASGPRASRAAARRPRRAAARPAGRSRCGPAGSTRASGIGRRRPAAPVRCWPTSRPSASGADVELGRLVPVDRQLAEVDRGALLLAAAPDAEEQRQRDEQRSARPSWPC